MQTSKDKEIKKVLVIIRFITLFFIVALVLSGVTAFPVQTELNLLCNILGIDQNLPSSDYEGLQHWIAKVTEAITYINAHYPFLAYGYDWLAFAHIVIAVAFLGVLAKPIRNIWIVYFGMIACVGVLPLAFICGSIRDIPFFWQLIDCSFGVFGIIPLYILLRYIKKLERLTDYQPSKY